MGNARIGFFGGFSRTASPSALHSTVADPDLDQELSGPALSNKKRKVVEAFIKKMGGKRPIQRVLIANNGMAATKAIMSMRQWAYVNLGDERAIEFVALATRDDLNANAEFIRLADQFVEVPSGSNKVRFSSSSSRSLPSHPLTNPPFPYLQHRTTTPTWI